MKKKLDIIGVIPVKESSERVKGKNLRKFHNTNLYELKIAQLKKTKNFSKFMVSSESKKVLKIAEKNGFLTHLRDPYYSTGHVPMSEVYSYVGKNTNSRIIAWINVTNPLADHNVYDKAVELYSKLKNNDCLLSAVENKENYFFKNTPINFKRSPWPRSQDLKPLISLPFVISILKTKDLIRWGSCVGKKPYFFKLDNITALDIDTQNQFDYAQFLFKKLKKNKKGI